MDDFQLNERQLFIKLTRTLPPDDRCACLAYLNNVLSTYKVDKSGILKSLPLTSQPSCVPLSILSVLLGQIRGSWPTFDLVRCYTRAWKHLPEEIKANRSPVGRHFVSHVDNQVRRAYGALADLLPSSNRPALVDGANPSATLSQANLLAFVRDFRLPLSLPPFTTKPVVAIALCNGPVLGLALLAVTNYFPAAPLSTSGGPSQFRSDILQAGAKVILVADQDIVRLGLRELWVIQSGIAIVIIQPKSDSTFGMSLLGAHTDTHAITAPKAIYTANGASDTALLLFTSGTSGKKKSVPISVHTIVSGVSVVIDSWGLLADDVCLNMMPLFHVGGIVRNLFAPLMAGGSTICCSAFNPTSFWDIVQDNRPTWYYASPTMHSMILAETDTHPEALQRSNFRLICNAAGGLLPSLACNLRDTFGCVVLPSYGMTECMPISSPPLDYQLQKPGTSGKSVGPELCILDANNISLPCGAVGRIAVRGAPLFAGYLADDGQVDQSSFDEAGWFDTGDMGHLDDEGYLYLTGRSKEVVNRGGEIISPFEVEEAILCASQDTHSSLYGRVSAVLAFAAPHDALQEVVGVVLVVPPGALKPCIRTVRSAVKHLLNQVKLPDVIVYMHDLPRNNNKIVRVKIADRMGLPDISTETPLAMRHWEAVCPPSDTALTEKIVCLPCRPDLKLVTKELAALTGPGHEAYTRHTKTDGFSEAYIAPDLLAALQDRLDDLSMPSMLYFLQAPFHRDFDGSVDASQFDLRLPKSDDAHFSSSDDMSSTEGLIAQIYAEILRCNVAQLIVDSDFFQMGGDSLRAGHLLSRLRREFHARLPIDLLFTNGTIQSVAHAIDAMQGSSTPQSPTPPQMQQISEPKPDTTKMYSSTNVLLLLLQLIPIVIIYPMKRALTWTMVMYLLSATFSWPLSRLLIGRLVCLVGTLAIVRTITQLVCPLFAIALKWVVIGRYQAGMYPMWGPYHTRWWLVQKIIAICGRGHFGLNNTTLIWYYRLLGATIGQGVKIHKGATLGEYDLIELSDFVDLDKCICRGFAVERNTTMMLGPIYLGRGSSVGLSSIIAPGSSIPAGTCIGPNSSSWELAAADESNRDLTSNRIPTPYWLVDFVVCLPYVSLVGFIQGSPWFLGLLGIVTQKPGQSGDAVYDIIAWFAQPKRITFHYLALVMNAFFGPMAWFLAVLLVKLAIINPIFGRQEPGTVGSRSYTQVLRMALLKKLAPIPRFHNLIDLFGSHYEMTSRFYRAMGARVGKRVYWPGSGPSVQDFELLSVGDDVIFGSRSHLVTSDGYGSTPISIGNNAMVSDRVVLLPGVSLGERTVLGSGAVTRYERHYEADTVWVGSKHGDAVCLSRSTRRVSVSTVKADMAYNDKKQPSTFVFNTEVLSPKSGLSSGADTLCGTPRKTSFGDLKGMKNGPVITEISEICGRSQSSLSSRPKNTTSATAFGRAFYDRMAPYYVFGTPIIIAYCSFLTIFTAFYWNVAIVSSVQVVASILSRTKHFTSVLAPNYWSRPICIYILFTTIISILLSIQAVVALALVIGSKRILLGTRRIGNHDWDKSPYCQRWQLFLTIERIRRNCYSGQGIVSLLTGTHYLVLYYRLMGAKIGSDVALFASGSPSCLLTEPDLLTLGDRVAIDDASLVGHINSRGKFDLNELSVGAGSVLRSGSRLLSGARMGTNAVLLEHTLVMAGDVVEDGCVVQGWPGEEFNGDQTQIGMTDSARDDICFVPAFHPRGGK